MVYRLKHAFLTSYQTIQNTMNTQHFHTLPSICKSLDTVQTFLLIVIESLFVQAEGAVDISQTWSSFALTIYIRTTVNDGLVNYKNPKGTDHMIQVAHTVHVGHFEDMEEDSQEFQDVVLHFRKALESKIHSKKMMLPKY